MDFFIDWFDYLDQKGYYKAADKQSSVLLRKYAMTDADAYRILDISQNATPQEIKKAYHSKTLKFHPDANPNVDPNIMVDINLAYEKIQNAPLQNSSSNYNSYKSSEDDDYYEDFYLHQKIAEQFEKYEISKFMIMTKLTEDILSSKEFKDLWNSDELWIYNKKRMRHLKKKYEDYSFNLWQNLYDYIRKLLLEIEREYPAASLHPMNFMSAIETAKVYNKDLKKLFKQIFHISDFM
jgi:hypothetical protein